MFILLGSILDFMSSRSTKDPFRLLQSIRDFRWVVLIWNNLEIRF